MRPYCNLSDAERATLGVQRVWDPQKLLSLTLPSPVVWVHASRQKFHRLDPADPSLIKEISLLKIHNGVIKTTFGSYSLETGKNIFSPCGCKKFCDCYGQLYLFRGTETI